MATRSRLVPSPVGSLLCLAVLGLGLAPPPATPARPLPVIGPPLAVLAIGFHDLQGLVVRADGTLAVSDRRGGVVSVVTPHPAGGATVAVLYAGLQDPRGLAEGPDGALLAVEAGAGRVVRLDPTGPTPVWTGLTQPTWLAAGPDGTLAVTARCKASGGMAGPAAGECVLLRPRGASEARILLDSLHAPGGLAWEPTGTLLVTLERQQHEGEKHGSSLLRVDPALPPGAPGAVTELLGPGLLEPVGPGVDPLGRYLLGARQALPGGFLAPAPAGPAGLVLVADPAGTSAVLGYGFVEVRALGVEAAGHLVVATATTLYRLRAPAPPVVKPPPAHTPSPVLALSGTAEPAAVIGVRGGQAPVQAAAHPQTGAFAVEVALTPNAENRLAVHATGQGGRGLASTAAPLGVTHDDQPPETLPLTGPAGEIGMPEATFTWTGADALTPTEALTYAWRLDGGPWSAAAPLTLLRLTGLAPGTHVLEAAAQDLAGNRDPTPAGWTFTVRTLSIAITTPAAGAVVPAGPLLVRGTVEAGGQAVGVSLLGRPVPVSGTAWGTVMKVPVGQWELVATATTASGATASHTQTFEAVPAAESGLELRTYPAGGPAPLAVTFNLSNLTGRRLVQYELDIDDDGTVDFSAASFESPELTYTAEGLHLARLRATDDLGAVHVATALVAVVNLAQLQAQHLATYAGLRDALRRGDIPAALTHIHSRARARYEVTLRRVPPEKLAAIDQHMPEAVPVNIGYLEAEYEIRRVRDGQLYGYPLFFRRDTDGIWRVWMF